MQRYNYESRRLCACQRSDFREKTARKWLLIQTTGLLKPAITPVKPDRAEKLASTPNCVQQPSGRITLSRAVHSLGSGMVSLCR